MPEQQQVHQGLPDGRRLQDTGAVLRQQQAPAAVSRRPEKQGDDDAGDILPPDASNGDGLFRRQQQRAAAKEEQGHGTANEAVPEQGRGPAKASHLSRETAGGGGVDQEGAEDRNGLGGVNRNISPQRTNSIRGQDHQIPSFFSLGAGLNIPFQFTWLSRKLQPIAAARKRMLPGCSDRRIRTEAASPPRRRSGGTDRSRRPG